MLILKNKESSMTWATPKSPAQVDNPSRRCKEDALGSLVNHCLHANHGRDMTGWRPPDTEGASPMINV